MNPRTVSGIAKSSEQIRTMSFNSFRLIDSIGHLSASLRVLTDNLKSSGHNFPLLHQSLHLMTEDENGQLQPDPEKIRIATTTFLEFFLPP